MRISILAFIAAGLGVALASLPAVAQSTTRIEPRPFYGATVTIEEGVRVFRPLPPHDRVIINPGHAAWVGVDAGGASHGQRGYIHVPGGNR